MSYEPKEERWWCRQCKRVITGDKDLYYGPSNERDDEYRYLHCRGCGKIPSELNEDGTGPLWPE